MTNPFDEQLTATLVRVREDGDVVHVLTRESSVKEFKESFSWASIGVYARTMAAFANARGGYIIFGITDNPRLAAGLNGAARGSFDNLDQARLTAGLNDIFSPELHWEIGLFEAGGVTLGSIYTHESNTKPVVAKKSYQHEGANLTEGDIVYRYNSRTERAKYPELMRMLDEARMKEQRALMAHFDEILKAGASNAAVLDFGRSTLQGPSGQKVLIDEGLLKQISFIREGEFDEISGAPTLKLIGEVTPATTIAIGPERIVREALTTEDVLTDFLDRTHIGNPDAYIRQAAAGSTSYVPVQFYRQAAGLDADQLLDLVRGTTTRSQAKHKLVTRLASNDAIKLPPPSISTQYPSTVARRAYYDLLVSGDISSVRIDSATDAKRFLEAVKSLNDEQVAEVFEPLLDLIRECFDRYYGEDAGVADNLRRAVCRVDFAMYGHEVEQS